MEREGGCGGKRQNKREKHILAGAIHSTNDWRELVPCPPNQSELLLPAPYRLLLAHQKVSPCVSHFLFVAGAGDGAAVVVWILYSRMGAESADSRRRSRKESQRKHAENDRIGSNS